MASRPPKPLQNPPKYPKESALRGYVGGESPPLTPPAKSIFWSAESYRTIWETLSGGIGQVNSSPQGVDSTPQGVDSRPQWVDRS
eukprot:5869075-Pyramimonas_sp.AAC.1